MRFQVGTILAVSQRIMKSVVDLKDSLGDFQKPNENEDKQLLNAFKPTHPSRKATMGLILAARRAGI
jgi:hypothetical protein